MIGSKWLLHGSSSYSSTGFECCGCRYNRYFMLFFLKVNAQLLQPNCEEIGTFVSGVLGATLLINVKLSPLWWFSYVCVIVGVCTAILMQQKKWPHNMFPHFITSLLHMHLPFRWAIFKYTRKSCTLLMLGKTPLPLSKNKWTDQMSRIKKTGVGKCPMNWGLISHH